MKNIQTAALLSSFALLSACGGKLVEFGEERGDAGPAVADGGRADVGPDGAAADTRNTDARNTDALSPLDALSLSDGASPSDTRDAAGIDVSMGDTSPPDASSADVQPTDASDAAACGQAPVVLGAAGNFAVLAGSTVTSTGATSVIGDLGVSPGTAVTGFPPGTVVGSQHAGDPTSAAGMASLTTAYNDAAGRTLCPVSVAGNLGGQTLKPGLYKSTSSLEVSSGDLTLDGQGDPDAVFIFQMASTLTTTSGRQVILIGNAKAANVFWQVGTSATLGSTSLMQGTVMADQAITLNTGAVINGRLLARIAAVILDASSVVRPVQ